MPSQFLPPKTPNLTYNELVHSLKKHNHILSFSKHPIYVVGIRGYYLKSMGNALINDRGIYDDALFLVSKNIYKSFNANTDPGAYKKNIASLKPGLWLVYQLDMHRPKNSEHHFALCQRGGSVTVLRDNGNGGYFEDTGDDFGINIHRGGYSKVNSLGCQTIYPDQWNDFINTITALAEDSFGSKWSNTNIPYILIEGT